MAALSQREHRQHPIKEHEDVGALRRAVAELAARQPGLRTGEAELIATELGTNLLRHADPGGYVLYRPIAEGIEFLSVDSGPGMDGDGIGPALPPTGQTQAGLSAGLNSIRRLAAQYDLYSDRRGSVILVRLGGNPTSGASRWRYGGVNVPLGGDGPSGDAWAASIDGQCAAAFVVDGLGHGPEANEAARAAVDQFRQRAVIDPAEFLGRAHQAMRGTRGGVAAVCAIDAEACQLVYTGLGNIAGEIRYSDGKQYLSSNPGTLGTHLAMPRTRVQHYRWATGSTLIMCSDGIRAGWGLSAYPGLVQRDPAVIAAVLHRDFTRTTDDATVLVMCDVPR